MSAAQALTIEAPLSTRGGGREISSTLEILGVSFSDVLEWGASESGLLFEGLVLSPSSVGTTVFSYPSDGIEFDQAAFFLTNGIDGFVLVGDGGPDGGISAGGAHERHMFAHDPLSTGGPDAAGMNIARIGFRLDSLVIETPGSDPNGDGIWTDIDVEATIVLEGELAPDAVVLLTRAQQACVNWMNKSGEKVNKAKLRENERCMLDFQRGKLVPPMTFSSCLSADRMGKVQKAKERTVAWENRKCDPLAAPPAYAYSDAATVNAAAAIGGWWLTHQIFGSPSISDAGLATKASDPETAKCQLEMLRRADKLENTLLKEFVKAKKRALKDETVSHSSVLAARLVEVFSSNVRVERARSTLLSAADRRCAALQVPPAEIFAGHCGEGNPDLRGVGLCAGVAAHCAACAMINAFDDLHLDCDQLDDQIVNGSCPAFGSVSQSQLTNADCFPSSVPDSASMTEKLCIDLANSAPDMVFTPADYQGMPEDCKPLVNPICR